MKKTTFLTALLFGFITQKSNAQVSLASNAAPANDYIGYDAGHPNPLNFATAGSPYQMTLTTAGNIDIFASATVGYQINANTMLWNGGSMNNIYVGALSGSTNGVENTAIGYNSLHFNTADYNTAAGYYALASNTTGQSNTATGWGALASNTTGTQNIASGQQALYSNTTGSNNTSAGYESLNYNLTGSNNTATGTQALMNNTASNNTADGYQALLTNTTGTNNIAEGYGALTNNTTGTLNTAVGVTALYFNGALSGSVAIGDSALYSQTSTLTSNIGNVAVGNSALYGDAGGGFSTAVGQWAMRHGGGGVCTAVGAQALYSESGGGDNTATGYQAMFSDINGSENTAYGVRALYNNINSADNTAVGEEALYLNTRGAGNTATGESALMGNSSGNDNSAMGASALGGSTGSSNTAMGGWAGLNNGGSLNTYLGDSAGYGCNRNTMNNDVFIGYQSGPNTPSSNTVYIGNTSTNAIEAISAISITSWSDRRIKDSVKANVPGLTFINKLQPVTFHYNIRKENRLMGIQDSGNWPGKYDVEKITQSGFIAQQVDSAAKACNYIFNGVTKPKNPHQPYTLGYSAFVVPLVKAVQELNAKNDTLRSTVDSLRSALQNIQNCLSQICGTTGNRHAANQHEDENGNSGDSNAITNVQNITLSASSGEPLLYQNIPNPFTTGTKINYYLPVGTVGAIIIFYDTYGNQLKTVNISQTGNGTLNITPDNLSNGIYSYSLIVNGNVVDAKKMLLQK